MNRARKCNCFFLVLVILLVTVFCGTVMDVSAAERGRVNGTDVNVREDATVKSKSLGKLSNVEIVINSKKKGDDGYEWYNITHGSITGYIRSDFIEIYNYQLDKSFEEQIAAFPESYRAALRNLHAVYPNWRFRPDKINMTLDEAVQLEIGRKKVQGKNTLSWLSMDSGAYDWKTGVWISSEGGWYKASREVIKYYMDVRNFLNFNEIYTFMTQNYIAELQTQSGVEKIVKGTFLENGYTDENDKEYGGSYVKVIMAAAKESGVNPYILAATIIQEQGVKGESPLISGKYSGYEGYYNYFNYGATGVDRDAVIKNGLSFAKNMDWHTRSDSIIGGAIRSSNNYVKKGQNTYFYINYNIKNPDNIGHQYATAVHNAVSSGKNVSKTYIDYKDAELDFLIPVYKDMPSTVSMLPDKTNKLNNYYFDSISVSGLTPTFERFVYKYDLKVSGDVTVKVTVPAGASYVGATNYQLKVGINNIVLRVRSQTDYTNDYTISVNAEKAAVLYVDTGSGITPITPQIMRGDTNGDGKVNGRDAANVQMHILDIKKLTGDALKAADTNSDGKINGRDAANIQMHILDIKYLT